MDNRPNIIIYRTVDGKASVALYATDGKIWLNQQQMAELFATSKPNISMHISNILKEKELNEQAVVKNFLTTEISFNSFSFRMLAMCILMFGLEVAKSSAICCWLSHTLPALAKRATDDLPSAVLYMIMFGWSLLIV